MEENARYFEVFGYDFIAVLPIYLIRTTNGSFATGGGALCAAKGTV